MNKAELIPDVADVFGGPLKGTKGSCVTVNRSIKEGDVAANEYRESSLQIASQESQNRRKSYEDDQAAVVPELGAKLEIREPPVPEPGPGQVLVRMQASACHTDIHAACGDWPVKPNPPFTPGHEGDGIIEEPGPRATQAGRPSIAWLGKHAGMLVRHRGRESRASPENSGYPVDGAWAEYAVAFDSHVVTVPEAVSSFDAAPLACAGVTTFKAARFRGSSRARQP